MIARFTTADFAHFRLAAERRAVFAALGFMRLPALLPQRLGQWLGLTLLVVSASSAWAAEGVYVVKRGDTLTAIARQHGVSVAELAERNNLARSHHVIVGQRLRIPASTSAAPPDRPPIAQPKPPAPTSPIVPKAVADAIQQAPVKAGRWRYIVIHHSGTEEGTLKGMDRYHRENRRMENGLAYHFVIGNGRGMSDGEIAVGPRWRPQLDGGHLRSVEQNKVAIGICLVGNFDQRPPTPAQLRSLDALCRTLMRRCNLPASAVRTHQQINITQTRCPGSKFPARAFLNGLRR